MSYKVLLLYILLFKNDLYLPFVYGFILSSYKIFSKGLLYISSINLLYFLSNSFILKPSFVVYRSYNFFSYYGFILIPFSVYPSMKLFIV